MDFRATTATMAAAGALMLGVQAPRASAFVKVRLIAPIPALLSAGEQLKVAGSVLENPPGTQVALEARSGVGAFGVVAHATVHSHRFKLSWQPPAGATSTLRLSARHAGRLLARSSTVQLTVGPAPRYCPAASAPGGVTAGDGWVQGGLYDFGGPAPGSFTCVAGPYEISAVNEAGEVTLATRVAGLESYTLVLPPGSYELQAQESSCLSEEFIILAGRATHANTLCEVA